MPPDILKFEQPFYDLLLVTEMRQSIGVGEDRYLTVRDLDDPAIADALNKVLKVSIEGLLEQ